MVSIRTGPGDEFQFQIRMVIAEDLRRTRSNFQAAIDGDRDHEIGRTRDPRQPGLRPGDEATDWGQGPAEGCEEPSPADPDRAALGGRAVKHEFVPRKGRTQEAGLRGLVHCASCGKRCKVTLYGRPENRKTNYTCTYEKCTAHAGMKVSKLDAYVDAVLMRAAADHEPTSRRSSPVTAATRTRSEWSIRRARPSRSSATASSCSASSGSTASRRG
jgi:hypothetical protein